MKSVSAQSNYLMYTVNACVYTYLHWKRPQEGFQLCTNIWREKYASVARHFIHETIQTVRHTRGLGGISTVTVL